MRLIQTFYLSAAILAVASAASAFDDSSSANATTWECDQTDGTHLYTNKEKDGCSVLALKPISVVPDLEHMPTAPRTLTASAPHYEIPPYQDNSSGMGGRTVQDWARDWHAGIAPSGSVQQEACSLYSEWMHLVQKTRGGFYFGSDPSYGGDITGRNQRGPSYSFYDNARYIALSRLFGTGFVPVGCF
ncbi:MAG: hypothetical protein OEV99_01780 [Nitrospira sp.]|nr:hypothetical protein [Nitrospira sp.]MDH4368545.1 hypothetical protein [Nitrospira sp.]MDH5346802.1 hypothetical protein [Nitrospira sp.]MDH5496994.1 hypothetical protein [Nitrospira sp.]MDH5724190.1 hypothetical protein [Nitrospira sp.]